MKKIVAVMGSYRKNGIIAQSVNLISRRAKELGAEVKVINLSEKRVEFCTNCRSCTQVPGEKRGECVLKDDADEIFNEIEKAHGIVLAAPVNCYNLNALTRRLIERLVAYYYWPWGSTAPKRRFKKRNKKAVLLSSGALPSFLAGLMTGAMRALGGMAEAFGAEIAGKYFIGLAAMKEKPHLSDKTEKKLEALTLKLLE